MIHSELVASIAEKLDVSTKDAAAALSAVTAVSYTHLDVYKRQH